MYRMIYATLMPGFGELSKEAVGVAPAAVPSILPWDRNES